MERNTSLLFVERLAAMVAGPHLPDAAAVKLMKLHFSVVRRTPKRTRNRKPTLASVAKQIAKAGVEVARYEIGVDGKIAIIPGRSESTTEPAANPWDEVFTRDKH